VAHIVDELIMHQRKKPRSEVCTFFPQMLLSNATKKRVLNQIVSLGAARSAEGARIASQPWNFLFDELCKFRHRTAPAKHGYAESIGGM
jgi:hypothetical protein